MNTSLQKALRLSQKTGDRLIVFDSAERVDPFVIVPMDEYEMLLGEQESENLTEEELIDKINRDIANWKTRKSGSSPKTLKEADFSHDFLDFEDDEDPEEGFSSEGRLEDFDQGIDSEESGFEPETKNRKKGRGHWQIPSEIKNGAEEVIEEDRHYLEEVPF